LTKRNSNQFAYIKYYLLCTPWVGDGMFSGNNIMDALATRRQFHQQKPQYRKKAVGCCGYFEVIT
jgi:hypothetical protein